MPFTGPIEDRLQIRELYGTYADASWRGDRETWIGCWTPDGRWTSPMFASPMCECTGHTALRAQWDALWQHRQAVMSLGEIGSIEVAGNAAHVRSYAREDILLKTGGVLKLAGRYDDKLVLLTGRWHFARRTYTPMFDEPPG
jgi:ketosteroid isomerase-like protein